jgi:hypothetical protein
MAIASFFLDFWQFLNLKILKAASNLSHCQNFFSIGFSALAPEANSSLILYAENLLLFLFLVLLVLAAFHLLCRNALYSKAQKPNGNISIIVKKMPTAFLRKRRGL